MSDAPSVADGKDDILTPGIVLVIYYQFLKLLADPKKAFS
jgi:hypothetical protein